MPIYVYRCQECDDETEEFHHINEKVLILCDTCKVSKRRVPCLPHTDMREFHNPIQMQSLGCSDPQEIRAFQLRNPDAKISTDPKDPLYGVPIAHTRKEKLDILKAEGWEEKK